MNLPIMFSGVVRGNKARGRRLGYRTANIPAPAELPDGIYTGHVTLDTRHLAALVFIGASVTFNETDRKAEVHILDFEENLYGKKIHVGIEKMLRENKKFDSERALTEQMAEDEKSARAYFKRNQ